MDTPRAIAAQNRCRCPRDATGGRPGEYIGGRSARTDFRCRAPITTPVVKVVLRGPLEPEQYTSEDYIQQLDDARVLASVGTVGDAYDNALAESFVDSFKTELIADRVWRTHTQLELAVVEYVAWFNHVRLHSSLGNRPPVEHEQRYAAALATHPEGVPRPTGIGTLSVSGVDDPCRGRLRPTVVATRTNLDLALTWYNYLKDLQTRSPSNSEDEDRRLARGLTYRQTDLRVSCWDLSALGSPPLIAHISPKPGPDRPDTSRRSRAAPPASESTANALDIYRNVPGHSSRQRLPAGHFLTDVPVGTGPNLSRALPTVSAELVYVSGVRRDPLEQQHG